MIYTVQDMLPHIGRHLGGSGVDATCEPGRTKALDGLNRATRMLMVEDRCTVDAYAHVPVSDGLVTLDRRIKSIISAKVPGMDQMPIWGKSARFLDGMTYDRTPGACCLPESLEFAGNNFVLTNTLPKPLLIFAVSDRREDADSKLVVLGLDEQQKELRTVTGTSMVKGIEVPVIFATCDTPPQFNCGDGYHSGLVSDITMLRKERTSGYVQVWGLDEYTGKVYWLVTMAPDETAPGQVKYRLNGGKDVTSLFIYCTLQFQPMYDLNDISLIQQPDALDDITYALHFKDKGDYGGYQTYRNAALALIRKDKRHEQGTDHRINVRVEKTPLRGNTFTFR